MVVGRLHFFSPGTRTRPSGSTARRAVVDAEDGDVAVAHGDGAVAHGDGGVAHGDGVVLDDVDGSLAGLGGGAWCR